MVLPHHALQASLKTMVILPPLALACLCVLQRALFRIIYKRIHGFDVYGHRFVIECTRNLHHRFDLPIQTRRYGRPVDDFSYPKFYHAIASLFPARSFPLLDRFMGPVLDGMFSILLYAVILDASGEQQTAVWMTLVFIFTPAFSALISLGPRMSSFTPRGFSEIITNIYWLAFVRFAAAPHLGWFGLAVLCGAIIFWSSKFSLQALAFITLALCIFSFSLLPLLVFAASFALAMLIARKVVWLSLRQQYDHLKWYCIQNLKGQMTISDRNSLSAISTAIRAKQLRTLVNLLLVHNSYFIAVVRFPMAVIALYLVSQELLTGRSGIPAGLTEGLILAGFTIFLLSSLKWLLFIGEAERYLNHILIAILLYSAETILPYAVWICLWGAVYGALDLIFAGYLQRKDQKLDRSDRIIALLKEQTGSCNVLEIPYGISGGSRMLTETEHNWVYPIFWPDKDREAFTHFMVRYPTVDLEKLHEVIPAFSVQIVMVDSSDIDQDKRSSYESSAQLVELGQIDNIHIYRTMEPLRPGVTRS